MEHGDGIQQELTSNKRHQAIHQYLFEMMRTEPELYFASTNEVSRRIHELVKKRSHHMSLEDQKLVKGLSVKEIEDVLSFHSHK